MLNTPFAPWPSFTQEEADAVQRVLLSNKVNYWTGTEGREFEKEFAAYTGCKHAIALANGTVALELALEALGIQPGDEVITTSYTFIASASAIVMRGAVPVLADVDPESLGEALRQEIMSVLGSLPWLSVISDPNGEVSADYRLSDFCGAQVPRPDCKSLCGI